MEEEISLLELLGVVRKRLGLLINITLITLITAAIYTFFIATPEYSSTTQLIVNRTQQTDIIQRADIDTNVQLINTYKDIIKGPVILDDVREELNMDITHGTLSEKITISSENNSQVFSISVSDINPYTAAATANTTAAVFQEKLAEIMNVDNVTVISQAEPPLIPISPNHTLNLAVGVVVGLVIGTGLAFLVDFLDNTVKSEKFIVEELGWTNLGRVSEMSQDELSADGSQSLSQKKSKPESVRSRV